MTFTEAETKLKSLAGGKYSTISYSRHIDIDGTVEAECGLYISGGGYIGAPTWRDAFEKLIIPTSPADPAPEGEA